MAFLQKNIYRLLSVALIMLLSFASPISIYAGHGDGGCNNSTSHHTNQDALASTTSKDQKKIDNKPQPTNNPHNKSVLDAEVLASPISYFKNAFSSEDEDSDSDSGSGSAIVLAIKAIVATLLSTIM